MELVWVGFAGGPKPDLRRAERLPQVKDRAGALNGEALDFTDADAVVVIDMANKSVREGHGGGAPAMATMAMTADTGNAYWQGKVNLPLAMAKKGIRVEGNVASLLKLAPMGKKLLPGYIQRLKDDGRDDMLV